MRKIYATTAVLFVLALPALAHGQDNSAIDQYTENVPSGDGDGGTDADAGSGSSASGNGSGGSGSDSDPDPGTPTDAPEDSQVAPPAATDTGVDPVGGDSGSSGGSGASGGGNGDKGDSADTTASATDEDELGATSTTSADDVSASPISSETEDDSGGIGALPIILGITLLAALAYAGYEWYRRRPSGSPPAGA